MTAGDSGQSVRPPALGDVTVKVGDGDGWDVYRAGRLVASGVDYADVRAMIRGEAAVEELAGRGRGGRP